MKFKKTGIAIALILSIAIGVVMYNLLSVKSVEVIKIQLRNTVQNVVCNGVVQPEEIVNVALDRAVIIKDVFVESGDEIEKGDRLFTYLNNNYTSTYYSDYNGIVKEINVFENQKLSEYKTAAIIYDTDSLYIKALISENDINKIESGQHAVADCCASNYKYNCEVYKIYSTFEQSDAKYNYLPILLSIKEYDKKLLPGYSATVDITVKNYDNSIVVPQSAVFYDRGQAYVYKVNSGTVEKAPVVDSDYIAKGIVITRGLSNSDEVVYNHQDVDDKQKIKEIYVDW